MTRRQGPACLVMAGVCLLTLGACAKPDTGTTLTLSSSSSTDYFAASSAGAFVVAGDQALTVAKPGAEAQAAACCSAAKLITANGESQLPLDGSVALNGSPWVILADGSAIDLNGKEHATAAAIRQLEQALTITRPSSDGRATTARVGRWVQQGAVSVVDSGNALAATESSPGSTRWHSNDSVIYRVGATGNPVAVAGRPGLGLERPVSGLSAGERVSATAVNLERALALVALDQSSFVLFMVTPTTRESASKARLQAAVVVNGQISRLKLPDLCADEANVVASRVSDHEVMVSALKSTGNCSGYAKDSWIRIDTAKNSFSELGSGDGFAAIAGNQLLTATTTIDLQNLTTVRWQGLPTLGQ